MPVAVYSLLGTGLRLLHCEVHARMTETKTKRLLRKETNRPGHRARSAPVTHSHPKTRVVASVISFSLVVGVLLTAIVFFFIGGRWFIITTPSMGESAPVGTLVLTLPTQASEILSGEVITFHPPTTPEETYTHRVQSTSRDGQLTTQGDINGATDPWTISQGDLIGRSILLPGLGWLIRALPILLIGTALLWILTRLYAHNMWRAPLRIMGIPFVVSSTSFILKPFVSMTILATDATSSGANAAVVSTGLLPIRVQAVGGSYTDLASGGVGQLSIPSLSENGAYQITSTLHLAPLGWAILATVCLLPLLWCLLVGLPPTPAKRLGSA